MSEKVNHPDHYKKKGDKNRKECIVEMEEKYGTANVAVFCLLSAYKYLYRAGNKEGESYEEDIAKAKWYYQKVLDMGAPLTDMYYYRLKTDIERKIKEL